MAVLLDEPEAARCIEVMTAEPNLAISADARLVGDAYTRWGKGVHHAGLNFGDCFAYVLATMTGSPLLFVGTDFSRTDVVPA